MLNNKYDRVVFSLALITGGIALNSVALVAWNVLGGSPANHIGKIALLNAAQLLSALGIFKMHESTEQREELLSSTELNEIRIQ